MCQPCLDQEVLFPVSPHSGICCMMGPQGFAPVTPAFDAPAEGEEMQSADMQLPICGQCPPDVKRNVSVGSARGLPTPNEPTDEERAIHNLTHIPYRSWCPYCVAGKRNNTPQLRVSLPRDVPLLSADYGFISDPGGDLVTILVVHVSPVGAVLLQSSMERALCPWLFDNLQLGFRNAVWCDFVTAPTASMPSVISLLKLFESQAERVSPGSQITALKMRWHMPGSNVPSHQPL